MTGEMATWGPQSSTDEYVPDEGEEQHRGEERRLNPGAAAVVERLLFGKVARNEEREEGEDRHEVRPLVNEVADAADEQGHGERVLHHCKDGQHDPPRHLKRGFTGGSAAGVT